MKIRQDTESIGLQRNELTAYLDSIPTTKYGRINRFHNILLNNKADDINSLEFWVKYSWRI